MKQSGIDPLALYSMKNDDNEVSNVAQSMAMESNDLANGQANPIMAAVRLKTLNLEY